MSLIEMRNITKIYRMGENEIMALAGVSLSAGPLGATVEGR